MAFERIFRVRCVFFSLLFTQIFASYVANPVFIDSSSLQQSVPDLECSEVSSWLSSKISYEKEYMQDMNLQFSSQGIKQRVQFAQFYGNFLSLTANIAKRVDLFAKGGVVNPFFQFANPISGASQNNISTNRKSLPLWNLGAKFLLIKKNNWDVSLSGSYLQTEEKDFLFFQAVNPLSASHAEIKWYQWQVCSAIGYSTSFISPYAGGKYSRTILSFDPDPNTLQVAKRKFDNRRRWGFFLGSTIVMSYYLEMNFEARLIDEQSWTGAATLKF